MPESNSTRRASAGHDGPDPSCMNHAQDPLLVRVESGRTSTRLSRQKGRQAVRESPRTVGRARGSPRNAVNRSKGYALVFRFLIRYP